MNNVFGEIGFLMCRNATIFLLQRLKGGISADAHVFNNIETRSINNYFFLQGNSSKEIHAILTDALGENATSNATIKYRVAQFKRFDFFARVALRR
jgi:hypothetical protein